MALSHIKVGNERQRAMPEVFELTSFHAPWAHGDGGVFPFQGLDAGHLVGGYHTLPRCLQGLRLQVQRSDIGHFLIGGCLRGAIEPVATPMRFEVDLILKNARRGARK